MCGVPCVWLMIVYHQGAVYIRDLRTFRFDRGLYRWCTAACSSGTHSSLNAPCPPILPPVSSYLCQTLDFF